MIAPGWPEAKQSRVSDAHLACCAVFVFSRTGPEPIGVNFEPKISMCGLLR
jgi:hypothetical protein